MFVIKIVVLHFYVSFLSLGKREWQENGILAGLQRVKGSGGGGKPHVSWVIGIH